MPKASNAPKDATKGSFGVQEGNVEIVSAVAKIHQYPANKQGVQSAPFGCVQLGFRLLDKDFAPKSDEDTATMEFGWGDQSLEKFHPGKAGSATDDDPEDLGTELDTEGNCIYSDGSRIGINTSWIRLTDSMEACGFRPEVLGNGYLPDLVGLKGHVHTKELEKWAGWKKAENPTQLVFDKIVGFPYTTKGKSSSSQTNSGKTTGNQSAAPPSKPASSASSGNKPGGSGGNGGNDPHTLAIAVLTQIRDENPGKEMDPKAIKSKATAKLMRLKVPVPQHKGICVLLTDTAEDGFLASQAEEIGYAWDGDEEKVIFPGGDE